MKVELKAQSLSLVYDVEVGRRGDALHGDDGLSTALRSVRLRWQELKVLGELLCPGRAGEGPGYTWLLLARGNSGLWD